MFEVGKIYDLVIREDDEDNIYMGCKILSVSGTLIKVEHPGGDQAIYNTASLAFISASEMK